MAMSKCESTFTPRRCKSPRSLCLESCKSYVQRIWDWILIQLCFETWHKNYDGVCHCDNDFCFGCGSAEFLEGRIFRTCTKCNSHYFDHRFEWEMRVRICLFAPLWSPLSGILIHALIISSNTYTPHRNPITCPPRLRMRSCLYSCVPCALSAACNNACRDFS